MFIGLGATNLGATVRWGDFSCYDLGRRGGGGGGGGRYPRKFGLVFGMLSKTLFQI